MDFGWLNMVDVYRPPYQVILVRYLIGIRDSFYKEGALPPWCQLTGTLGRSCHHEDETTFVIRVKGTGRSEGVLFYLQSSEHEFIIRD